VSSDVVRGDLSSGKHVNPGVEVRHLVGKISTAETRLSKVPKCPGKHLLKWWAR
jgi:hypothetical protein